jgi:hypothetical protein
MTRYIGSNDRETLAGIEEILKKRIASEMRNETTYKTQRDRRCATYAVSVLQDILADVVDAMIGASQSTQEQLADHLAYGEEVNDGTWEEEGPPAQQILLPKILEPHEDCYCAKIPAGRAGCGWCVTALPPAPEGLGYRACDRCLAWFTKEAPDA